MKLKQLAHGVFYISGRENIGVIVNGDRALIVDSGLEAETGKKILRLLEGEGLRLAAIVNTHSHADHCGGNAYLKAKTGAKVYAPELEAGIIQYPYLEPLCFFSGARPLPELKNKFLMAEPSEVDHVIGGGEARLQAEGIEVGIVPLPGHTPSQIGVEAGGVLFCADSIFSRETLDKHKILFYTDIGLQKQTLAFLKESRYKMYVPSHGEPAGDIGGLVDATLKSIEAVEACVWKAAGEGRTAQEILKAVCDRCGVRIKNIRHYFLMNTIILAHLSYLQGEGKVEAWVEGNGMWWRGRG